MSRKPNKGRPGLTPPQKKLIAYLNTQNSSPDNPIPVKNNTLVIHALKRKGLIRIHDFATVPAKHDQEAYCLYLISKIPAGAEYNELMDLLRIEWGKEDFDQKLHVALYKLRGHTR